MRIHALALLVLTGCITNPREGYPVDAVAQLEPAGRDPLRITGTIELLGTGTPIDVDPSAERTFAAYRVDVSDDLGHAVVLLSAASCIDPTGGAPDRLPFQYLGSIRRIGDEVHFFTQNAQAGNAVIDIDTETATGYASPDDQNNRIVIVSESVSGGPPVACGVLRWR